MTPVEESREKKEITAVVYGMFEAGKNKDLTSLSYFHSSGNIFTKFDEFPPYTRQTSEQAIVYEQATFANISDYEYNIQDLRVDLLDDVAIATFYLEYKGVFINNYSFEGKTIGSRSRVTMVLAKFESSWKIVHEHFSTFPEWPHAQKGGA
ncbi:MAG: nuclear transport factor 2 family protein [Conexivisphaerales archaeon]